MRLFPAREGGTALTYEMAASYLNDKKLTEYDIKEMGHAIKDLTEVTEVQLSKAPLTMPENEYAQIMIDPMGLVTTCIFFPPSDQGNLLTKEDIFSDLAHENVRFGINETEIASFLQNRQYCKKYVLARAKEPVQGKSAFITYHFKTEGFGKPRLNEDGTVDFHQLDMINHVAAGDCLATLTPAVLGVDGMDVCGRVIKAASVVHKHLKYGRNIRISEDQQHIYSEVSGHVTLADDTVFVSDTYDVPADVSVASGDIDYDGNVEIHGNVVTGFSVRAKGDIIVNGVVEGAYLEADGQIILKRGIQGMGRGILRAKGNITAKFMESCEVYSGGDITTDAIMHSKVRAKGKILATGKKGMIAGGDVKAKEEISVKILGASMGTATVICIGMDDETMEVYHKLDKEIPELIEEQKKLSQIIMLYKKKIETGEALTQEHAVYLKNVQNMLLDKSNQIQSKSEQLNALRNEIESFKGGRVKFSGVCYPGVKVIIANVSKYVKESVRNGQFVRDGADIRWLSL